MHFTIDQSISCNAVKAVTSSQGEQNGGQTLNDSVNHHEMVILNVKTKQYDQIHLHNHIIISNSIIIVIKTKLIDTNHGVSPINYSGTFSRIKNLFYYSLICFYRKKNRPTVLKWPCSDEAKYENRISFGLVVLEKIHLV